VKGRAVAVAAGVGFGGGALVNNLFVGIVLAAVFGFLAIPLMAPDK
jgi:hypothetical protein